MKKPAEHSAKIEEALAKFRPQVPELEFPFDPDFVSKPPRLPWAVIFRRSEERLEMKVRRPDFEERRLARKNSVEFVL